MNLYISSFEDRLYYYTLNDFGHVYDLYPEEMLSQSAQGSFYIGVVKEKKSAIGSAFVNIGEENNGLLSYSDAVGEFHSGDSILVQAVRNSKDRKGAKLTMKFSLEGSYCVLLYGESKLYYSQKMAKAMKREIEDQRKDKDLSYGFIVRSCAESGQALWQEMKSLSEQADALLGKAKYIKGPCLVKKKEDLDILHNLKQVKEIYTNDKEAFEKTVEYVKQKHLPISVHFREENYYRMHDIAKTIAEARQPKIWLPSGAYLIIEKTEAMNVIDVNTGKSKGSKDKEMTNLKINREAAKEIARQIRLRNLSGIILVDFINLKKTENQEELIQSMTELIKFDPVPTQVHGLTKLGIMEITRKKKYETLEEWWLEHGRTGDGSCL